MKDLNESNLKAEKYRTDAQERIAMRENDLKLQALAVREKTDKRDSIIATIVILLIIGVTVYLSLIDKLTPALAMILGGAFTTFSAKYFGKFLKK